MVISCVFLTMKRLPFGEIRLSLADRGPLAGLEPFLTRHGNPLLCSAGWRSSFGLLGKSNPQQSSATEHRERCAYRRGLTYSKLPIRNLKEWLAFNCFRHTLDRACQLTRGHLVLQRLAMLKTKYIR